VRVIVAASGQQLGVLKIQDALRAAQNAGLDLVEVAPTANPPVCRIVDFGKFKYEISKQDKEKKLFAPQDKQVGQVLPAFFLKLWIGINHELQRQRYVSHQQRGSACCPRYNDHHDRV
jgi:hypothetical protein